MKQKQMLASKDLANKSAICNAYSHLVLYECGCWLDIQLNTLLCGSSFLKNETQ